MIGNALPWTLGLLTVTTLISWILGSLLGAVVGWSGGRSRILQALVPVALILYTTPYYILAIILIYLLASLWPKSSRSPAAPTQSVPNRAWSWDFIADVIRHGALPALSIILVSLGWWFLSMRSLIISEQGQDYILWAEAKGLPERPHLLGLCLPQRPPAPDDRPRPLDRQHRRRRADHRGRSSPIPVSATSSTTRSGSPTFRSSRAASCSSSSPSPPPTSSSTWSIR